MLPTGSTKSTASRKNSVDSLRNNVSDTSKVCKLDAAMLCNTFCCVAVGALSKQMNCLLPVEFSRIFLRTLNVITMKKHAIPLSHKMGKCNIHRCPFDIFQQSGSSGWVQGHRIHSAKKCASLFPRHHIQPDSEQFSTRSVSLVNTANGLPVSLGSHQENEQIVLCDLKGNPSRSSPSCSPPLPPSSPPSPSRAFRSLEGYPSRVWVGAYPAQCHPPCRHQLHAVVTAASAHSHLASHSRVVTAAPSVRALTSHCQ